MNRAERRIKKALIRARILRRFEDSIRRMRGWHVFYDETEIAVRRRRALRNEGKRNTHSHRCGSDDCDWNISNRTYQARRETQRMAEEYRRWNAGEDRDLSGDANP